MGDGGFFKGEKKKQKKGKDVKYTESTAPVFSLPKLVEKKPKEK